MDRATETRLTNTPPVMDRAGESTTANQRVLLIIRWL